MTTFVSTATALLVLAGCIVAAIAYRHAPEATEDDDGFHRSR